VQVLAVEGSCDVVQHRCTSADERFNPKATNKTFPLVVLAISRIREWPLGESSDETHRGRDRGTTVRPMSGIRCASARWKGLGGTGADSKATGSEERSVGLHETPGATFGVESPSGIWVMTNVVS